MYTTMFFDGITVTKSRVEVVSSVVTEVITIGLAALKESLFGVEHATSDIQPSKMNEVTTVMQTSTFLLTEDDGSVRTKTLVRPQVMSDVNSIEPTKTQEVTITDFVSNSVVPSDEQLNALKESFFASFTESPELEPSPVYEFDTTEADVSEGDIFVADEPTFPLLNSPVIQPVASISVVSFPTVALGLGGRPQQVQAGATVIEINNSGSIVVVPTDVISSTSSSTSPPRPGGLSNLLSIPSLSAIGTLGLSAIAQSLAANGGGGLNIQLGPVFDAMSGLLTGGLALAGKRNDTERRVDTMPDEMPNFIPVGAIARPAEPRIPLQGVPLVLNAPGSPLLRPGANVDEFRRPIITPPGVPVATPNIIFVHDSPARAEMKQIQGQRPPLSLEPQRPSNTGEDVAISPPIALQEQPRQQFFPQEKPQQPLVFPSEQPRPQLFPQVPAAQQRPLSGNTLQKGKPPMLPSVAPGSNAVDRQDTPVVAVELVSPVIFKPVDDPRKPIPVPGPGSIVPGPNGPVRLIPVNGGRPPPGVEGTVFIRPVPETPVPVPAVRRVDNIPSPAVIQPSRELPSAPSMVPFIPSVVTFLPSPSDFALPEIQTIVSIEGDNRIVRTNIISNGRTFVVDSTEGGRVRPSGQVVFPSAGLVFFPDDNLSPTAVVSEATLVPEEISSYEDEDIEPMVDLESNEVKEVETDKSSSEAPLAALTPDAGSDEFEDDENEPETKEEETKEENTKEDEIKEENTKEDEIKEEETKEVDIRDEETKEEETKEEEINIDLPLVITTEKQVDRKEEVPPNNVETMKIPTIKVTPVDEIHDHMTINHFAEEVKNMVGTTMHENHFSTSEESVEMDHSSETPSAISGKENTDILDHLPVETSMSDHPHDESDEMTSDGNQETRPVFKEEDPKEDTLAVVPDVAEDNVETSNGETVVSNEETQDSLEIPDSSGQKTEMSQEVVFLKPDVEDVDLPKTQEAEERSERPIEASSRRTAPKEEETLAEEEEDDNDAIHDTDLFKVDDKDNEISRQDKGQLSAMEKPVSQCSLPCSAEHHEICDLGEAKCVCRRGYARLYDSAVCEKSFTYKISMILEKMNGSQLKYENVYEEKTKPRFLKISNLAKRGIENAFMDTNLASVFRGTELSNIESVGENEKGIRVNMLVHVKAGGNTTAKMVMDELAKKVDAADLTVDSTVIVPARQQSESLVTAEDFDECLNDMHDCPSNANCLNMMGTFTCQCKDGYEDLSSSNDTAQKGRVCAAAVQACKDCNFSGACKYDDKQKFLGCECREWYSGETCNINLKVLMIALITVGSILLLVISCIVLICCLRARRAKGAITSGPSFLRYRGPGMPVGTLDRTAIIRGDTSSESSGGLDNHGHTGEKSLRSSPPSTTTSPVATLQTYRPYGEGVGMLIPRAKHQHVTSYPTQPNLALTPEELAAREHQLIEYLEKGRGKRARLPSSARNTLERQPQSTFRRGSEGVLTSRSRSSDALSNLSEMTSVHGDRISEVRSYDETTVRPAVKTPPYRNAKYEDDSSQFDSL